MSPGMTWKYLWSVGVCCVAGSPNFQPWWEEEFRAPVGRVGAAVGAGRALRTPECGTLCCRQRWMEALLQVARSSSSIHLMKPAGIDLRAVR